MRAIGYGAGGSIVLDLLDETLGPGLVATGAPLGRGRTAGGEPRGDELGDVVEGHLALRQEREERWKTVHLPRPDLQNGDAAGGGERRVHAFGIAAQRLAVGGDDQRRRKRGQI